MTELFFPTLGAAVIVIVLLPCCAALSRLLLLVLDRVSGTRLVRWSTARYLLLVLPSLVPLAWALSAGVHQAESRRLAVGCIFLHELEQLCVERWLFVGLLALVGAALARPVLVGCPFIPKLRDNSRFAEAARLATLVATNPMIASLRGRVVVTEGLVGGSAAIGVWRPVVAVDVDFVDRCDDETLVGALAHELEHLRGRDTVRYLLLALAMRLNPLGAWLLRRDAAAWVFRREVECDRQAVLAGAEPLAVAHALLCASRPSHPALAHVRGGPAGKVRLRVELLLAYAEQRPRAEVAHGASVLACVLLVAGAATFIPHFGEAGALDLIHTTVERVASTVFN